MPLPRPQKTPSQNLRSLVIFRRTTSQHFKTRLQKGKIGHNIPFPCCRISPPCTFSLQLQNPATPTFETPYEHNTHHREFRTRRSEKPRHCTKKPHVKILVLRHNRPPQFDPRFPSSSKCGCAAQQQRKCKRTKKVWEKLRRHSRHQETLREVYYRKTMARNPISPSWVHSSAIIFRKARSASHQIFQVLTSISLNNIYIQNTYIICYVGNIVVQMPPFTNSFVCRFCKLYDRSESSLRCHFAYIRYQFI